VIGSIQEDRATAIAGTLGSGPKLIPIRVTLTSARGAAHTFNFKVVDDQLFTPLLAYVSLFNTLGSYERQFGAATFSVKGTAQFADHASLDFDDIFTGDGPIAGASAYVAGPLTMLLANDLERVDLKSLDLNIAASEDSRSATIERVWIDEVRPRAGQTVPLKVLTRNYRGAETINSSTSSRRTSCGANWSRRASRR
jgi:hypothetical protein